MKTAPPSPSPDNGYGREFAGFYDRLFPSDHNAEATAETLASWHPGGDLPSLELGVGTGRVAIPLARRTGTVVGVDSSPEMLERLHAKLDTPDAPPVVPVLADIRGHADERRYGLVYCVCATLSMLLDPADQRTALTRAAERLAPGGTLVVETHNPGAVLDLHEGRRRASFFTPYPDPPGSGLLTCSVVEPESRLWQASQIWFEGGGSLVGTELSRLTTPEEVDDHAAAAGLLPVGRFSDWLGTPYAPDSPMYVTRYRLS
ncbi:class I SAM-dependent methyltransferase [Streptomyces sp. ZYX-F-203]